MRENLVHLKFEYSEAIQGKKDVLNAQKSAVLMTKSAANYRSARMDELKERARFQRKLKEMAVIIKKFQKVVPNANLPKLFREESHENKKGFRNKKTKEKTSGGDIDSELKEIQNKLNSIARQ